MLKSTSSSGGSLDSKFRKYQKTVKGNMDKLKKDEKKEDVDADAEDVTPRRDPVSKHIMVNRS